MDTDDPFIQCEDDDQKSQQAEAAQFTVSQVNKGDQDYMAQLQSQINTELLREDPMQITMEAASKINVTIVQHLPATKDSLGVLSFQRIEELP